MTTEGMLAYLREKVAPLLQVARERDRKMEKAVESRDGEQAVEVYGLPGKRYMLVLSFACRLKEEKQIGRALIHLFSDRDEEDKGPSHNLIFLHGSGWVAKLSGIFPSNDPRTDDVLALVSALWPPEIVRELLGGRSISIEDEVMETKLRQLVDQLDGTLGSFAA